MAVKKKKKSIALRLRNYFFTGVVVLIPIGFTLYLTKFLIGISSNFIPEKINPNTYLHFSIPGLEIEADDVRCTHGSTSGRVDEELIFYAQCRGFTRKEAIRAIVTGFFQQVFDRVTIESVREALALAISRRVRDYE